MKKKETTNVEEKKEIQKQKQILEKSKTKPIGFLEKISLTIIGKNDGRQGLARLQNNAWTSPTIHSEINRLNEFFTKTWGSLQIDNQRIFEKLGTLLDELDKMASQIVMNNNFTVRKHGEENLPENIIIERRKKEKIKKLEPFNKKLTEAIELRHKTKQNQNNTEFTCQRQEDHTKQRLDIYWKGVLKKHLKSKEMPIVLNVEIIDEAKKTYFEQHQKLEENLDKKIEYFRKISGEENINAIQKEEKTDVNR